MESVLSIDFDYFIRQGLLNREEVYRDLYDNSNDQYIGYISKYDIFNHTGTTFNIEENGEIHEYQGYVTETLPDNKIKINAEDRTIIVNANDCYTLEF